MPRRRSSRPAVARALWLVLAALVPVVLFGAAPAGAVSQTVILRVQTDGAAPGNLGLAVKLNCIPRGGIVPDYTFTGATTQPVDVTGAERCGVSVTDTTGASTSVGVACASSGKVTCENEATARWVLVGPDLGGTATFTITATYPAPTTTTTAEPTTTTTEEETTTTSSSTTTTGTDPPGTGTSVPPTLGTSSTTGTSVAPVATQETGSSSRLPLFIGVVLAFVAVLGALIWTLVRGRGGSGPDAGPGPSGGGNGGNGGNGGVVPPGPGPARPYGPPPDPTPGPATPAPGTPGDPPPTMPVTTVDPG